MGVECAKCSETLEVVHYRKPEKRPRAVKLLRALLLVSAVVAVIQVIHLIEVAQSLVDVGTLVGPEILALTGEGDAALRDFVRLFTNVSSFTLGVLLASLLYLLIRYVWLLTRAFKRASPTAHAAMRELGWAQVAFAIAGFIFVGSVFEDLETTTVKPSFGVGILLGPIALLVLRRKDVKAYFSVHVLLPVPPAGEGTVSSPGAVERAVSPPPRAR